MSCGRWMRTAHCPIIMTLRFPRTTLLAAGTALTGCFFQTPERQYNPFLAPADSVLKVVSTVVVTPVVPPQGVVVSDSVSAQISSLIEARLRQAGFSVVPRVEYARIWDGILRQLGGFFDPLTGERDEGKFGAAREELLRELKGRFDTQVLLYAELQVVDAYVDGGVAAWDGAEQDIGGERSAIAAEYQDTFERDDVGGRGDGTVSAVTLMVAIDGPDGVEMYRNFGGLEVLARRVVEIEGEFAVRAEPERAVQAVERVLGPLLGKKTAQSRRGQTPRTERRKDANRLERTGLFRPSVLPFCPPGAGFPPLRVLGLFAPGPGPIFRPFVRFPLPSTSHLPPPTSRLPGEGGRVRKIHDPSPKPP